MDDDIRATDNDIKIHVTIEIPRVKGGERGEAQTRKEYDHDERFHHQHNSMHEKIVVHFTFLCRRIDIKLYL